MAEFSRSLAIVIGINQYGNGISFLKTAVNDAKAVARILEQEHKYDKVWLLLDEQASLQTLQQILEQELSDQIQPNDRLLFYFAGHGIALNGEDGPEGFLIPQDARLGDTKSYLPMSKLQASLSQLPCRHFLGILDCCFAGAFRWSSTRKLVPVEQGIIHKERYDRFIVDPAWQVITSAAYDQTAMDFLTLDNNRGQVGNHSPFAAALIEALSAGKADLYPPADASRNKPAGDGVTTATDLYTYLRERIEPETEGIRQRQTPGIWTLKKHDKGEYIFLTPGHVLNLPPAPLLDVSKNPYRGLESYDEEHSQLFFGRTQLVEKLKSFIKTNALTVVLGASGSGKSSLVKAGLIPELRQATNEQWLILPPVRPSETPLQALNNALKTAQLLEIDAQNPKQSLAKSIDIWAEEHPNTQLFLFIDQSEEVITLCQNENDRREFFRQILTAIGAHWDKLRVVLSLRSDFEPQLRDAGLQFVPTTLQLGKTELKDHWHSGRFIVPAMTRGELREAIEKPAETRVMYFQPRDLVEQLIDEVADMPGALPLLSFALSELYLKYLNRQGEAKNRGEILDRALTEQDYQDLGGVIQSLTQKADEEYEALVKENPAYAQTVRHVMLRMVSIDGGLARRKVPLSELEYPEPDNQRVKEVIRRFLAVRLFVSDVDNEDRPYIELAHDVLIAAWGRLVRWINDKQSALPLRRRLTVAAEAWKSQRSIESGRKNSYSKVKNYWEREDYLKPQVALNFLWDTDPYLNGLKEVMNSGSNNWLNTNERAFVERSLRKRRFQHSLRALERTPFIVAAIILSINLMFSPYILLKGLGFILLIISLTMFKSLFN